MIAQHVGLGHRDRVLSLILACTTPGGNTGAPNPRLLAASLLRPFISPRRTGPLIAPALYSSRTRTERRERMLDDLRRRSVDPIGPLTAWMQMAAIAGHDTRARLGELDGIPTTVIHGHEDSLVPIARGAELADGIPGARLVEIPHAGHVLMTDDEDGVASAVAEHLERASVTLAG